MRWCYFVVLAVLFTVVVDSRRVTKDSSGWKPHKPDVIVSSAKELKSNQVRGVRNTHFAGKDSYGAPGEESTPIDLHNKEFCVDVSTYQPVVWVEHDAQECETVFVKQCGDKSENVCQDVTETHCEVVPYKECKSTQVPQQYTETKLQAKKFVEQGCTTGKKTIPHTKLLPECRNVTKQNCVTLWETDSNGKQVWAGTDACEPVTWQECKLVPKDVKFIVPEIKCEPKQELWYHEPEEVTDTRMTNTFDCIVKSTSHCTTQTRPDCKTISWKECSEVPVKNCSPKSVHVPTQELLHRKKCLLPDEGEPQTEPLPTYSSATPPPPVYTPQPSYQPAPQPSYQPANPAPSSYSG